jgi:H+/Cl- antiporter ClcA
MGTLERTGYASSLFIGSGLGAIIWLYLVDTAEPLLQAHAGPFQSQWELLQWVFPTTLLLIMFVAGLYIVYGGIQEERKADRRKRRQ